MALSETRLRSALETTLYAAFSEFFGPKIPAGATPAQTAKVNEGWDLLSKAIAKGVAKEVILEIDTYAVVNGTTSTPNAQAGVTTLPGTFVGQID